MPLQYCLEPECLLEFVSSEDGCGNFIIRDEVYKRVRTDAELDVYGEQFFVKRFFEDGYFHWFEVVKKKVWNDLISSLSTSKGI